MAAFFREYKWQIVSLGLAVGLALSLSVNIYQNFVLNSRSDIFELTICLDKYRFNIGETVNMSIRLTNTGTQNERIVFGTSPNPSKYWFWSVHNETQDAIFYHNYVDRMMTVDERTLKPGQFMQSTHKWGQKATKTAEQVPPGIYYLIAKVGFSRHQIGGEVVLLETQQKIIILTS